MSKTIKIIASDGETLFDGADPDRELVINLSDIGDYDNYVGAVHEVTSLNLTGPTTARLILLLSMTFLQTHGEKVELSSAELREQS